MYTYEYFEKEKLWGVYNQSGKIVAMFDYDFQAAEYCDRHNK